MALSASDMAALTALGNVTGQLDWSQLMGAVTLGTPKEGTPTLAGGTAVGNIGGQSTLAGQQTYSTIENERAGLYGHGSKLSTNPGDYYAVADTNGQLLGYVDRTTNMLTREMAGNPYTNIANWRPNTSADGKTVGSYTWQGPGNPPGGVATVSEPYGVQPGNTTSITSTDFGNGAAFNKALADQTASGADQQDTLAKSGQNAQYGLGVLQLLASLNGPADAFHQQAVLHGLDATGMSKAVGAIQGKYGLPSFAAPNANPAPQTLGSIMNSVGNAGQTSTPPSGTPLQSGAINASGSWAGAPQFTAPATTSQPLDASKGSDGTYSVLNPADGGTTVYGGTHIHMPASAPQDQTTASGGGASNLDPTTQAYVDALPNLNKLNGPAWLRLDPDTKQFLTSAYQAKGYSANDVGTAIKAGLPQFSAPSTGLVKAA